MRIESAPFELQIKLQLRGHRNGPLVDGDSIVNADRIQVTVRPSEDVYLYVGYCTADGKLAMFPAHGSLRARAGQDTIAPGKKTDLVVDGSPGTAALYVVLSRAEISSAHPRLAAAIGASRPPGAAACGDAPAKGTKPYVGTARIETTVSGGSSTMVRVEADADGIAVRPYRFQHLATAPQTVPTARPRPTKW